MILCLSNLAGPAYVCAWTGKSDRRMNVEPKKSPQRRSTRGKNRTQQTLQRLRADIISGKLPPGSIIRDVDLADIYGVSTSPIREALTLLETEQLVMMPSDRVRQVAPISRKTTEEIGELVILLMDYAIGKGIGSLKDKDLKEMDALIESMRVAQEKGDTHTSLGISRRFFDIIIRAGGNEALRRTIMVHAGWIERLFTLAIPLDKSGWTEMAEAVFEALKNKDHDLVMKVVQKNHAYFRGLISTLPLHG